MTHEPITADQAWAVRQAETWLREGATIAAACGYSVSAKRIVAAADELAAAFGAAPPRNVPAEQVAAPLEIDLTDPEAFERASRPMDL